MGESASRSSVRRVLGRGTVAALFALALVPRLFVAWTLPLAATPTQPECAPDEGLQYWTVMRYADGDFRTWPASGSIYSAYPPAPYALHAAALATVRVGLGDRWPARFPSTWWRLRSYPAARLGGVVLGGLTVVLAALAVATWTDSRRLAIASGVAVAFLPQLVFVDGYVNGDAFTIAAVVALAAALARWAVAGEGAAYLASVGAASGLVLLAKPTGYAALVPTALWLGDACRRGRLAASGLARAGAVALAVAAPVLGANAVRNGGDPLGLGKYRTLLATEYVGRPVAGTAGWSAFVRDLARSSFAVFRHGDLPLASGWYLAAAAFVVVGIAAGIGGEGRARGALARRAAAWLASSLGLGVALVVWNGLTIDAQAQGRYLLPVLVPSWAALTCALAARWTVLPLVWLGFLVGATGAALVLVHAHPCV